MKNNILKAIAAILWISPLIGSTMKLNIVNTTGRDTLLTISDVDQKKQLTSVKTPAHKRNIAKLPINQAAFNASISSLVPPREQMTPIERYDRSRGWLFVGLDAKKNHILKPLLPVGSKGSIPEKATASYKNIKGVIMRVDEFPEMINEADTHRQTLKDAAYAKAIEPNSYLMITQKSPKDARLAMHLYDFRVAKSAAVKLRKKK